MSAFTASNGVVIEVNRQPSDGKLYLVGRLGGECERGTHATASEQGIAALREFFDRAKPWHNAQPGEVWVLAFSAEGGGGSEPWTVDREARFTNPAYVSKVQRNDWTIADGRRLWPEPADV